MKTNKNLWGGEISPAYEAPELSVVTVKVESGFATSFEGDQTPTFGEEKIEW